eukprot:jgi/Mesvir1/29692/Mv00927-RA.1
MRHRWVIFAVLAVVIFVGSLFIEELEEYNSTLPPSAKGLFPPVPDAYDGDLDTAPEEKDSKGRPHAASSTSQKEAQQSPHGHADLTPGSHGTGGNSGSSGSGGAVASGGVARRGGSSSGSTRGTVISLHGTADAPAKATGDINADDKAATGHASEVTADSNDGDDRNNPDANARVKAPRALAPRAQHVPRNLRIYIYDDVAPALNRNLRTSRLCHESYSSSEIRFPEMVARSSIYTRHGELADFYLVPVFTECYMLTQLQQGTDYYKVVEAVNKLFARTLDTIQSDHAYWSRTEGRDHVFIFPSERGAAVLKEANLQRIKKSVFLTGVLDRHSPVLDTWKDVIIPPGKILQDAALVLPDLTQLGAVGQKDFLAHFRGTLPGEEDGAPYGLRQKLALNLRSEEEVLFRTVRDASCNLTCALQEMLRSRFCFCPRGVEGWSTRIFDALALGCIPVIVADNMELPFEDLLDFRQFSVKLLENDMEDAAETLRDIPWKLVRKKQEELAKYALNFVYHDEWVEGLPVVHTRWLRQPCFRHRDGAKHSIPALVVSLIASRCHSVEEGLFSIPVACG